MLERQQCPVLSAVDVMTIMRSVDVRGVIRRAFVALAHRHASQPPQTLTLFPDGSGDFIAYLGVLAHEKVFGAKLSPYITQPAGGLVTAWTLLMSMETGEPILLCDSQQLTTERTAATTTLAVDLLASPAAAHLAVIGSGPIAQAHIRYAAPLRSWTDIRVYSPRLIASQTKRRDLEAIDPRAQPVADLEAAVHDADVIMLCTSSGTPVLDPASLSKSALITSISTNVAGGHEVPPASLSNLDVYCDYRATTPRAAGEMLIAASDHGWTPDAIVGDLPECLSGRARLPDYHRHAFFRSVGLGIQDIAIAGALRAALPG